MTEQVAKNHWTLSRARELRTTSTDAERKLGAYLRRGALEGLKFRRQQPFGPYIPDFYYHEGRLVTELDGAQHFEPGQLAYDARRTGFPRGRGLRVLRFTNLDVLQNPEGVVEKLLEVASQGPLSPALSRGEREH